MELEVYHTQEVRDVILKFPYLAEGNDHWLGDGFYFWQDIEFSEVWGFQQKCFETNESRQFCIFKSKLYFQQEEFIDTVFNEYDYYNYVNNIEKFAKIFQGKFGKKPTLEEFNDFIADTNPWDNIKVIRFQDIAGSGSTLEVKGFFYKKRIQIRVNDPDVISNFELIKNIICR